MSSFVSTDFSSMDPRYQYLMARRNSHKSLPKFGCAEEGFIPVIGRVSALKSWQDLSEVQTGMDVPDGGGAWIVTGLIPLTRFAAFFSALSTRIYRKNRTLPPKVPKSGPADFSK